MARQLPLELRLRLGHRFDTLIPGDNAELVGVLKELAGGISGQVYLWGEPGCGRTHMLEAVVAEALERELSACLLPGRELAGLPPAVLEGMHEYQLVALDDVDVLVREPGWQEALFHFYNRCRESGGALVFAAAVSPRALELPLADLGTRLAAGGVYRVRTLGEDALVELLRQRAAARGLALGPEVARFMVRRSERSAGAITAHIERLDREAMAQKRRLTLPFVKQTLGW